MSVRAASIKYGINRMTIHRNLKRLAPGGTRENRRRTARETEERKKKIELAMKEVVETGMFKGALKAAARKYGIDPMTLSRHIKRSTPEGLQHSKRPESTTR